MRRSALLLVFFRWLDPISRTGYVSQVFGLGFGEMVILGIVLLVVVGPRELPKLLRTIGRSITKLRKMSTDLRAQSGIDDLIDEEGLREDINAIRSLSRGRIVDGVVNAASKPARRRRPRSGAPTLDDLHPPEGERPPREDEYPEVGCDSYGALADDAEPEPPEEDARSEPSDDDEPAAGDSEPEQAASGVVAEDSH